MRGMGRWWRGTHAGKGAVPMAGHARTDAGVTPRQGVGVGGRHPGQ